MSEEQSSPRSGLTVFTVGALIGAGIALLYAPQSGKETRKLLVKKAKQIRGKAEDTYESAQEFIKGRKADLAAAMHDGKRLVEHAKHKRA